jgi:hypothetical protein
MGQRDHHHHQCIDFHSVEQEKSIKICRYGYMYMRGLRTADDNCASERKMKVFDGSW